MKFKNIILAIILICTPAIIFAQDTNPKTITIRKLTKELSKNIQIVDVRTPKEFHEEHIKNSINYDFKSDEFKSLISNLNKEKPVYLYCRTGKRSAEAAVQLKNSGFKEVYSLKGGITKWKKRKLNIE
ncbi:rhodanese-like domain-containing protein [Pedobacter flavus]|uniref:Rhodanese-like domain-containing protein n=1 Tax=Pedobacter flavus TaxID=3113906 RepID=A0ABU7GYE5_9SPHI|nr:rhodanese-like domain-containing protein [Pedobacter sp. VNH31]MEE1884113.1 rhodanese-like domain-containing protein [Pedobacter sp. VNH31]